MHRSLIISFKVAFEGIYYAFRANRNLRIDFFIAILVVLASLLFQVSLFEVLILGILILLVLASEMINTSLEEMVNLITTEHRQEAKIAKDVAAGMVLVTATGAVIVGLLILVPYILNLF